MAERPRGRLASAALLLLASACSGDAARDADAGSDARGSDAGHGSSVSAKDQPLLGSARGGHVWHTFCEGAKDDAKLPVDPRTLVKRGVNEGKAVYFNAPYIDCHKDAPADDASPKTCGEYRTRVARADAMMKGGMWFFGGDYIDAQLTFSAEAYNDLWSNWGYEERPEDFEAIVAQRWGVPYGERRNPYPLPGEDPNESDGGTGQLPVALTQLRDAEGSYTGKIGMNCNWCHSGEVGDAKDGEGLGAVYGNGNSLAEIGALFGDFFPGFPLAANKVRGTGDILIYPAIAALDADQTGVLGPSLVEAPSQGSVDFPPWWNVGHRTRKFHDGVFSVDDTRPVMSFFMPILSQAHMFDIAHAREWIEERDQDVKLWVEAIAAPAYPGPLDEKLAQEGAMIFHEKDLFGDESAFRQGNGACASCHGAYSPRYVHDKRFLESPELEGIAAHVVPLPVIGTDPARYNSLTEELKSTLKTTWWAYGSVEDPGACFDVVGEGGYLAPPLYGVWASAPYFHNGSVPTVRGVLDPSERPEIWRRRSTPAPKNDPSAFMGFDTDLARAYDHDALGWRYDVLECGEAGSVVDCAEGEAETSPAGSVWFSWNLGAPPLTYAELEERKIYNTHAYSQKSSGHEFTRALSEQERRALIEYLKTL